MKIPAAKCAVTHAGKLPCQKPLFPKYTTPDHSGVACFMNPDFL